MNSNPHGGDIESVAHHLKLNSYPEVRLDFSVNVNPMGPPAVLRQIMARGNELASVYPDVTASKASSALAKAHDVSSNQILVGNGSTELFGLVLQAIKPKNVALIAPCYAGYEEVCRATDTPIKWINTLTPETAFMVKATMLEQIMEDLIFIGSPNNPTGRCIAPDILVNAAKQNPKRTIVVDESFTDFCQDAKTQSLIQADLPHNLIIIKSLTKFFAIPGLRLGMLCAHPEVTSRIGDYRLPWSVNAFAQEIAKYIYKDQAYIKKTQQQTSILRNKMQNDLKTIKGITTFPSAANFLLIHLPIEWPASRLQAELLKQGILIRNCNNFKGLDAQYCRLAVRPEHEIDKLIAAIKLLFAGEPSTVLSNKKTSAIMVVGTTSDAGKSIVAAGLCRLLARSDLHVAPFKAQNMALNSYVTTEGGEMGRAQVTQSNAAGIRPHTDMNPVLLKPQGDNGSQVIVNGKPIGNYNAREYYLMKSDMRRNAHEAYDRLAAKHDVIVLEGAGSPAEINLLAEDFVNMDMANYANAGTVLIADIDRGGVFASILGTIELIPAEHRHLIVGVIINKFRGDESLLDSGIRDIEAMTGVPVLGVLPYLKNLQIEEEDSLGLERPRGNKEEVLDVAVIRLPRISNYTDFMAMENDHGIRVRYVNNPDKLGTPDIIILPGTKNTRSDLQWLHDNGMSDSLHTAKEKNIPIFGICGGFQMLGSIVTDEEGIEGSSGSTKGLGMLDVATKLTREKELSQVRGYTNTSMPYFAAKTAFSGYEIHAGETIPTKQNVAPLTITHRHKNDTSEPAGAISGDGLVFGCYVHGFFDNNLIRQELWRWLCRRNNRDNNLITVNKDIQSSEFDRVADMIEERINLSILFGKGAFHF